MLDYVKVTLKGETVEGLSCDSTPPYTMRDEYFRLFHLLKQDGGKNACSLTFHDFIQNFCVLVYDFTATFNGTDPPLLPLVKDGHLRVTVEFNEPSKCPLTLITMVELQSAITIENDGKCTLTQI